MYTHTYMHIFKPGVSQMVRNLHETSLLEKPMYVHKHTCTHTHTCIYMLTLSKNCLTLLWKLGISISIINKLENQEGWYVSGKEDEFAIPLSFIFSELNPE